MSQGQYTITLDHEQGLVNVVAQGEIERELGEELITNARKTAAEYQYDILCDVRQSKAIVKLADWYFLPKKLSVYQDLETRFIQTAIIVRAERQKKVYSFFETVARNLGLRIKIFFREEDARAWLKNNRSVLG